MEYKILNKDNMQGYLYSIANIKEYFTSDDLIIEEIGDGNLNYVFIIKSVKNPEKALILKQAVPYLRCVGEAFPLSRERMTYEIRALKSFAEETSSHIPQLYHTSEAMSVVIMQFLDAHVILRAGMIEANVYPNFAEQLSSFLATNLFKTSSLYLDSTSKRQLIDKFNKNTELCGLSEDFVFTFALMPHESNDTYSKNHKLFEKLTLDMALKKEVLNLKYKFMTQSDALLHGDLHTGSIMVNKNETFVIDPEFAFIGPFGFDIGALLGNLVMSYASHMAQDSDKQYAFWILETIQEILEKFEMKFMTLWGQQEYSALRTKGYMDDEVFYEYQKEFMLTMLKDSLGFAGCKMTRRMFGLAGVADIRDIKDEQVRDEAIDYTLKIARDFILERKNITHINDVIAMIQSRCK